MAQILFWLFIFLIFYIYFGYSFLILAISVFTNRKIIKSDKDYEPAVSILIAAYNEEKHIRAKLENTLCLDYPKNKIEIVVISDGSTDRTDSITREFAKDNILLYRVEGRVGKTEARNRAVKFAKGEIVVFSDATTIYDRLAVKKMVRNFSDPTVGAVSGRYYYLGSEKSTMSFANAFFWSYENFIKARQSRIKTLTGMSGCINSFRKALYEPLPPHIIEDLVEPLKILEKGYRIVFEPEALARETTTDNAKQEFKMRIRVITQGMVGLIYMRKLLNPFKFCFVSFQLISHKVLRWFIPLFLIGLFTVNTVIIRDNIFYLLFFCCQLLFYSAALLGLFLQKANRKLGLFGFPLYFCTLNFAALISMINLIKQKNIVGWETQR